MVPRASQEVRLELPTDPERPMISRHRPTLPSGKHAVRQTVMGVPAPARPSSRWGWWVVGTVVLGGLAVAAWWFTHR